MQQVSTKRIVTYTVKSPGHEGAKVQVRPATEPERGHILWRISAASDGKDNGMDAAYEACRKHVVSWSDMPGSPRDFDCLPPQVAAEIMSFIAMGSVLSEEDAGN